MTGPQIVVAAVIGFVTVHVVITYAASERLNVFTALLMLSLLPATALGMIVAVFASLFVEGGIGTTTFYGLAVFTASVLPYTAQGLWEIVSQRHDAALDRQCDLAFGTHFRSRRKPRKQRSRLERD